MISIVICSRYSKLNDILDNNIKETIGVPYELILIDNSNNTHSIFSAYNLGIKCSKYPILCFIHEDIMFRTNNWGKLICAAFEADSKIGMIGVIGSTMIFDMTWGWWTAPQIGRIIQSDKSKKISLTYSKCNEEIPQLSDAAICDGLFLAFPRKIFDEIKFDTDTFKGFHGYDMDICMQVLTYGYEIKVIENVLVEHFSWGSINEAFIDACYRFYNKWKTFLPISCTSVSKVELHKARENYLKNILNVCPNSDILNTRSWAIYSKIREIYHYLKLKK